MQREPRGHRGHKDLQVCRQVYDVLTLALAEIDDPLIDDLVLARVMPAPNASRVLVILVPAHASIDSGKRSRASPTSSMSCVKRWPPR